MRKQYILAAPKGPFGAVETAARAEEQIARDTPDDERLWTLCTVAFAAADVSRALPGSVRLTAADAPLPEDLCASPDACGHAVTVLFGGADINPLTASLSRATGRDFSCAPGDGPEAMRLVGIPADKVPAGAGLPRGTDAVVLTGGSRIGVMYAAFAYAEREGVRYTEPGLPEFRPELRDPAREFDVREAPSYVTRGTFSSFIDGDDDFLLWMARNRMNFTKFRNMEHRHAMLKKLGIAASVGGHEVYYRFADTSMEYPYKHAVYGGEGKPDDPYPVSPLCRAPSGENGTFTYGDAHPEWYALVNGERRMQRDLESYLKLGYKTGDNICNGNPDCVREICRLATECLISGDWKYADFVDVCALDNGTWCDCEACRAMGNLSTRLLMLAYELDKTIKQAQREGRIRRKIRLAIPAYHETLPAPDRPLPDDFDYDTISVVFFPIERCFAHDFDDTACESNRMLLDLWRPWTTDAHGNYKGSLFVGEYYNVSSFAAMPFVFAKRILHDIPYYYRCGARNFHYMHITARDRGIIALNDWLYARMLWNVDADGEALLRDYFTARYGASADRVRAVYEDIERFAAGCKYWKHYRFAPDGTKPSLRKRLNGDGPFTAENLFVLGEERLHADPAKPGTSLEEAMQGYVRAAEALRSVRDGNCTPALERDIRRVEYGCRMTRFLYLLCVCLIDPASPSAEELRALASEMASRTDGVRGYDWGPNFTDELAATFLKGVYEKYFTGADAKDKTLVL